MKTRAPANHHHNSKIQPQETKHPGRRPAAAQPRGVFSLADKQTAKRSRNASARFPARPPRVFCVYSSSSGGGRGGARWSSPTTRSVGRSAVAERQARAERAPNARITRSLIRRAELCASRAARGDARKRGSSRSRPRRSQSLAAVRLARLDRRHLAAGTMLRCTFISLRKPPLRLVALYEHPRQETASQDGAPFSVHTIHPPSLRTKPGDRRDETMKRRGGGGGGAGGRPPLWFRRPRTALVKPLFSASAALSAALVQP